MKHLDFARFKHALRSATSKAEPGLMKVTSPVREISREIGRRVLPKSLLGRYTLALFAIAVFIILEQVIVQVALRSHVDDQRIARLVEVQQFEVSRLVKTAMSLQLASRESDIREHAENLQEVASEFKKRQKRIESLAGTTVGLTNAYNQLGVEDFQYKEKSWLNYRERAELRKAAQVIDKYNGAYRTELRSFLSELDQRSTDRIEFTTRVEFGLFTLTLIVLLLEGLYIFRPSIRALEAALRTRSDFMSRMSHEIRNPMNAIIGMTDVLFETPLNELQQRYLRVLSRSSQTLLDLLNSLLDFSSLESGKTKIEIIDFDLHTVLEKVVDLSAVRAHEKNLDLSLDIDLQTPLAVTGDPVRLQQVLSNLLTNAIKFTSTGEVRLTVKPDVSLQGISFLHFAVTDTGIGIKQEALSKIFESFVQADTSTRRQYGGSGLGLTIARELVSLMGGSLEVSSVLGQGSRFEFSLPLASGHQLESTLWNRVQDFDLKGRTGFFVGPMTKSMQQAADLIQACGGYTETHLQAVDLSSPNTFVIISPLADDSLIQFLPESVSDKTRVICLIQTILPATRMKQYMSLGVSEFVMAPLKPLEFLEMLSRGSSRTKSSLVSSGETEGPEAKNESQAFEVEASIRVLVVDDSAENRDLVKLYLAKQPNLELAFAADGSQALQKVQTENFDLVLTDIQMPVMDGIEELLAIREWEEAKNLPQIPVVAVTADSRPEARLNLARLGFQEILIKPIRKAQLLETLARYRTPKSPGLTSVDLT